MKYCYECGERLTERELENEANPNFNQEEENEEGEQQEEFPKRPKSQELNKTT